MNLRNVILNKRELTNITHLGKCNVFNLFKGIIICSKKKKKISNDNDHDIDDDDDSKSKIQLKQKSKLR